MAVGAPRIGGYGGVAKTLHWLVFALVFAQYVVAITMPDIGRGTVPGTLINLHMSLGITILLVVVVRWLWRIDHRVPLATADMPAWEQPVARITHALLYLLLVVIPILGWINASARDWTIVVFGVGALPHLVAPKSRTRHAGRRRPHVPRVGTARGDRPACRRRRSITTSSAATACCSGCCPARVGERGTWRPAGAHGTAGRVSNRVRCCPASKAL